jgi:hypothetical protein
LPNSGSGVPCFYRVAKPAKMSHDNNKIRRVGNVLYTKGKNLSYL